MTISSAKRSIKSSIKLVQYSSDDGEELRSWFSDEITLKQWAGPNFRFPHTIETFDEDLKHTLLQTYCLKNSEGELIAVGQFYQRLQCCHLGRLAVNPKFRNQGYAKRLIELLSQKGMKKLNLTTLSLFVLDDNIPAKQLYKSLGFIEKDYPERIPLENCLYLVKVHENK